MPSAIGAAGGSLGREAQVSVRHQWREPHRGGRFSSREEHERARVTPAAPMALVIAYYASEFLGLTAQATAIGPLVRGRSAAGAYRNASLMCQFRLAFALDVSRAVH
jgi:hypothetical protein